MNVQYGSTGNWIDVTELTLTHFKQNHLIIIPSGDTVRAKIYTDPMIGEHKKVLITLDEAIYEYDETKTIEINTANNTIRDFDEVIPIIVVCYNNYKYVQNTLNQIKQINQGYYRHIKILNNSSDCEKTIEFLKNVDVEVIHRANNGPWICPWNNQDLYADLPNKFILTDPDLKFNPNLPSNFIEVMSKLSDFYKCSHIGFALDILDYNEEMLHYIYYDIYCEGSKNIYNHEKQFWEKQITNDQYELYDAKIDTTFTLINKFYFDTCFRIRIAGNFTAKHMPWYKTNEVYNVYENYCMNSLHNDISTTAKLIVCYTNENYLKIVKNDEIFFIDKKCKNCKLSESIHKFDKYLRKDKIFLDLGIGSTTLYGSRKSKHVYVVETDNQYIKEMKLHLENNCDKNYTIINQAISHNSNINIQLGSACQIIKTLSISDLFKKYDICSKEISLIKVDIKGGEENILNDLFQLFQTENVPLYICFYYTLWNDKNLDRFKFLSENEKNLIQQELCVSILFEPVTQVG